MCLKQLSRGIDTDTRSYSFLTKAMFGMVQNLCIPLMFTHLTYLRSVAEWRIGDPGSGWRT